MTAAESVRAEAEFVRAIAVLAPVFTAKPGGGEFTRLTGWQELSIDGNQVRIRAYKPGDAICAVMGALVAAVDVDPRNGGDVDAVRQLLDGLGVTVFAEVATPGGGAHFYIAGHPELASVHSPGLVGYPGVDIQSFDTNVFLPGTCRPKYNGKGYTIVFNNLEALADGGDPDGAEILAGWVADNRVSKSESFTPSEPWDGTPPDARQVAYLGAMLRNQYDRIATMRPDSGRNTAIYNAGLACGNFIAGAGLDETEAINNLLQAANHCGLIADDGERSVLASIRSGIKNGRNRPRAVPDIDEPTIITGQPDTGTADEFWNARPVLAHIRDSARARLVSPWAVLACVLVRVVAAIPPRVVLPPIIGGHASLNMFFALVGDTAIGKGGAEAVAAEVIDIEWEGVERSVGSGEGIPHIFMKPGRQGAEPTWRNVSAILSVKEVDLFSALGYQRSGTTLLPVLRSAWMGEQLGHPYVDEAKRLNVPPHSYRLALILSVQPARAKTLLGDADGGTPQRFVFTPTADPGMLDNPPPMPSPWKWKTPVPPDPHDSPSGRDALTQLEWGRSVPLNDNEPERIEIEVPKVALDAIHAAHRARHLGTASGEQSGHHLLCREKVATALALLEQRADICDEDWDLAGTVMELSDRTREQIEEHLRQANIRANAARGHAEADRKVIVEEVVGEAAIQRVSKAILRALRRADGEWVTHSKLRKSLNSRDRDWFEAAIGHLIGAGQVEVKAGDRPGQLPGGPGSSYRIAT